MQPNDLTDAISDLLNTLQEQLATPGARSEMLGAMQARLLKGYLQEYVSLYNDAPLDAVLRNFPEQPMFGDAVAVLEHVVHRAQQRSSPAHNARPVPQVPERTSPATGPTSEVPTPDAAVGERMRPIRPENTTKPVPMESHNATTVPQVPRAPTAGEGAAAEDVFEFEKRLWLSTILQHRGPLVFPLSEIDDIMSTPFAATVNARTRRVLAVSMPSAAKANARTRRVLGVLSVGIGAALGAGAPIGFLSIPTWRGSDVGTLIFSTLVSLFAFDVIRPWGRKMRSRKRVEHGLPPLEERHLLPFHKRGPAGLVVGLLLGFTIEAITHISSEQLSLPTLLSDVALVAVVTWSWMQGTEHQPRQATALGARSGVIAGCLLGLVVSLIMFPGAAFRFLLLQGLHGGLLGFAGGLALDRGWGAQPKGMLKALLAAAFIYYILITPFLLWVGFGRYFVLFISELGFAAGWAIGVSDWHLRSPLQSLERRAASAVESPAGGGI